MEQLFSYWGAIQYKHHGLSLSNDALEDQKFNDSIIPSEYSASGAIDTFSFIYYLRKLKVKGQSSAFIGFGKGKFNNDYSFSYRESFNYNTATDSGSISGDVSFFTIGFTGTQSFYKTGEAGFEMGIDCYNLDQSDVHYLESVFDFYLALIWGY